MSSPECPYAVGAEFVLLVTPPRLTGPGSSKNSASVATRIRATVLQIYSFTKSQAMKISITKLGSEGNQLPSIAFLKLYDRRYLEERTAPNSKYPWSPERETEAERIGEERRKLNGTAEHVSGRNGVRPTPDLSSDLERNSGDEDNSDESFSDNDSAKSGDSGSDDMGNMKLGQWEIEERYRRWTREWFETESEAYRRLHPLQGLSVPEFFGTVAFDNEWLTQMQPKFLIEVRGILLQFIDGTAFDEIDTESPIALTHTHICQAAVMCFEHIIPLGVLHGDVRLANVMVRNSDGRVFLLDFALATLRTKESDTEWIECAETEHEPSAMKELLQRKALRDITPPEPFVLGRKGYGYYNSVIQNSGESWRTRYFEKISPEPIFEMRSDSQGEFKYTFLNWRIKQEASTARKKYFEKISDNVSKEFGIDHNSGNGSSTR